MSAFQFGQSVAQFFKQADAMRDKYQASGHAGTMSYEDFLEAHDDGPTPAEAPMPAPATPAPAQPQGGFFSRLGSRIDNNAAAVRYAGKKTWEWGTSPINPNSPAPKPVNPQWEAQRQNFEGSMF